MPFQPIAYQLRSCFAVAKFGTGSPKSFFEFEPIDLAVHLNVDSRPGLVKKPVSVAFQNTDAITLADLVAGTFL